MSSGSVETVASAWSGTGFAQLHPCLQSLHRPGGVLRGPVLISFGHGVAGSMDLQLARRLGIPAQAGEHQLEVTISHHDRMLHRARRHVSRWPLARSEAFNASRVIAAVSA